MAMQAGVREALFARTKKTFIQAAPEKINTYLRQVILLRPFANKSGECHPRTARGERRTEVSQCTAVRLDALP
jgi:hypothetical protein